MLFISRVARNGFPHCNYQTKGTHAGRRIRRGCRRASTTTVCICPPSIWRLRSFRFRCLLVQGQAKIKWRLASQACCSFNEWRCNLFCSTVFGFCWNWHNNCLQSVIMKFSLLSQRYLKAFHWVDVGSKQAKGLSLMVWLIIHILSIWILYEHFGFKLWNLMWCVSNCSATKMGAYTCHTNILQWSKHYCLQLQPPIFIT